MAPIALESPVQVHLSSKDGFARSDVPSRILHRDFHTTPQRVIKASGISISLANGQNILDASGGAAVACIGHGDDRIKKAIARQMEEVSYCHSLFFSCSGAEGLGRELIESTHGNMTKAFIVSSGSEAMEAAMKLARQYFLEISPSQPARTRFIARHESYHGTTLGSLSAGGHRARRKLFEPMLSKNTSHVSACNAYRGMLPHESTAQYVSRLAQELEDEFQKHGPETICAFVAEPVVGAALGCVPAVFGYFKAMKAVCNRHGALLILDEVMCGMGRTGTLHAWEQEGVVPDIQTIGKGLGGGYTPVAGILINQRVVDALDSGSGAFSHGQTYQGHPVACAAALEVQRIIRGDDLLSNVRNMGTILELLLRQRLENHPNIGDIRGRGLFWGIEFVEDKASKRPFPPALAIGTQIHDRGMSARYGISLYPGSGTVDGVVGDHILVAPPYNSTRDEIERIVDLTSKVIEEIMEEVN